MVIMKVSEIKAKKEKSQNIQVFVRVRPLTSIEKEVKSHSAVTVPNSKEILLGEATNEKITKKFTFHKVFGPGAKQHEVYADVVHPLVEEVLEGYSCTVFAYGQTGSGKTFTMVGENPDNSTLTDPCLKQDDLSAGIAPRCFNHLFEELNQRNVEFSLRVTYLELYNEEIFDLLSSEETSKRIRIYDDPNKKGSVIVKGLEEIPVTCMNDVYKIMEQVADKRKTATTFMNAQSSRSHTVFSILLQIKETASNCEEYIKSGKLNLVDLAGSENTTKSGNVKRERIRESVNINLSLLSLGRVITALSERASHVPYRDSKLTRLLQDSLGGRTKTSVIATISPGQEDHDETLCTLDYAIRAKNIENKPEANHKLTSKVLLKERTEEVITKNGVYLANKTYNELTNKLKQQARELVDAEATICNYKEQHKKQEKLNKYITKELKETSEKLATANKNLEDTQKILDETKNIVREKSFIIQQPVATEKQLTMQAKDLLSTVDETCEDSNLVDKEIETIAKTFASNLHEQFHYIEQQNEVHEQWQINLVKGMTQKLEEYTQTHLKSTRNVTQMISSIQEMCTNVQQCIDDSLINIKSSLKSSCQEYGQKIDKKFEAHSNLLRTTLKNEIAPALENIQEHLKIEDGLLKNINEAFNNQAQHRLDHAKGVLTNNKYFCENLKMYVLTSFASQKRRLQKVKETHSNITEKEYKYNQLMSLKLNEVMQTLTFIQNANSSHPNNINREVKNAKEILTEVQKDNVDIETKMSISLQQNIASTENFTDHYRQCHLEEVEKINNIYSKLDESKNACQSLLQDFSKNISDSTDNLINNLNDLNTYQKTSLDGCIHCVASSVDHNTNLIKSAKNKLEKSIIDQLDAVKEQSHSTISPFSEQLNQQKVIGEEINQFKENSASELSNVKNSFNKYIPEDLKIYSASDGTPVRKKYEYPTVLAATPPHNTILNLYIRRLEENVKDDSLTPIQNSMDKGNIRSLYNCTKDFYYKILPDVIPIETPLLSKCVSKK